MGDRSPPEDPCPPGLGGLGQKVEIFDQSGMGCLYVQDILDVNASKQQLLEIPKSLPFLSSYGPVGAATLGTNCRGEIGGI